MSYTPKVNDYVLWNHRGQKGWVYFSCSSYVTIETLVRPKDTTNYNASPIHRNERLLILCYRNQWNELTYVKTRNEVSSNLSKTEEE